jgi:hypothetical protein
MGHALASVVRRFEGIAVLVQEDKNAIETEDGTEPA